MPDGTPAYFDEGTGGYKPRTLVEVTLPKGSELQGLKSTARDINAFDGGSGVYKGGDTQIYAPKVKYTNPQVKTLLPFK
jgi:hypothetical protein